MSGPNVVLRFKKVSGKPPGCMFEIAIGELEIISFLDTYLLLGDGEVLVARQFDIVSPVVCDVETLTCEAQAGMCGWRFDWEKDEESGKQKWALSWVSGNVSKGGYYELVETLTGPNEDT